MSETLFLVKGFGWGKTKKPERAEGFEGSPGLLYGNRSPKKHLDHSVDAKPIQ